MAVFQTTTHLLKKMLEKQFTVMGIEIRKEWYLTKEKEIWTNEHGPKGGDEINIIKPENYGWPIITYGIIIVEP